MRAWLGWGWAALLVVGCRGSDGDAVPVDATTTGSSSSGEDSADSGSSSGDDGLDGLDPLSVPEPRAARLTDRQYRYTILDVLGTELTTEELEYLPRDIPSGRDYSTTAEPQAFDSTYVLGYAAIARSLSERLAPEPLVERFGGCGEVVPACRPAFVDRLGRRLLRRPLTEEERARYLDLAMAIAASSDATEHDVVRGILQAMLQSPSFLYRIEHETLGEPGTVRTIDGYELATRLSYFLWQSAPDEELLEFAEGPTGDGRWDRQALRDQIDRMLADPKLDRTRALFWGDYTLASRSGFATSDPVLAAELRDSLLATLDLISGVGGDPQPLSAIFDGTQLVMSPAVAEIAGAQVAGRGLLVYDVADTEQRLGVVTHPAMLASISTTSFVGRGLMLSERLLCQHISPPPPEVQDEIQSTAQATEDMTPRQASEFRFGLEAVCQGCHFQFEPIAYAYERYDITGRFGLLDEQGRMLYSDGVLPANGDRPEYPFADAMELQAQLANDPTVLACLVDNLTEFGTGQRTNRTGEFHALATQSFIDEGLTWTALLWAVADSEQRTLMRVVEP